MNHAATEAAPRPWQVRLALFYPGLAVVLPLLLGTCMGVGPLLANVAYILLHEPLGKLSLQAVLVLLCACVVLGVDVVLAFGLVAFWRGRSWGLVSVLGIVTSIVCWLAVWRFYPSLFQAHAPPSGAECVFLVALSLLFEALLLMPAVRRFHSVTSWSMGKLIVCGVWFGMAVVLGYLGGALSILGIAHWIKG